MTVQTVYCLRPTMRGVWEGDLGHSQGGPTCSVHRYTSAWAGALFTVGSTNNLPASSTSPTS